MKNRNLNSECVIESFSTQKLFSLVVSLILFSALAQLFVYYILIGIMSLRNLFILNCNQIAGTPTPFVTSFENSSAFQHTKLFISFCLVQVKKLYFMAHLFLDKHYTFYMDLAVLQGKCCGNFRSNIQGPFKKNIRSLESNSFIIRDHQAIVMLPILLIM